MFLARSELHHLRPKYIVLYVMFLARRELHHLGPKCMLQNILCCRECFRWQALCITLSQSTSCSMFWKQRTLSGAQHIWSQTLQLAVLALHPPSSPHHPLILVTPASCCWGQSTTFWFFVFTTQCHLHQLWIYFFFLDWIRLGLMLNEGLSQSYIVHTGNSYSQW